MESEQQRILRVLENKYKRTICKNAIWSYSDKEEEGLLFNGLKNTGCKNERQNGSSYCKECSNKHKNNAN